MTMRWRWTSIRPFFRSRADKGGFALPSALVLLIFLLPMGIMFYRYSAQALRSAVQERRQKTATQMANAIVTDYMRQFSQDPYNGHYDTDRLQRPEAVFEGGFSTVTFTADEINRTVHLTATGGYGAPENPQARRRLEALVQFSSDLTQFGTMSNGPFSISANNAAYEGGLWINGNLTVTGANVRFNGGPLVVEGNIVAPASAVLDGDLYYTGNSIGNLTVLGTVYNFTPSASWPALDFNYYDAHYTYKSTADRTIIFNSTGSFTVVDGPTMLIPPSGAILYCDNCSFTLRGVVSGRVTAVAGAGAGSCASAAGRITINDNLYYAGASSITASAGASFAALARNCVTFSKNASHLTAVGVYFVEQGTSNMRLTGSAGFRFWLYGVRTQGITITPGTSFSAQRSLNYDANLRSYPPPGLPERALLVGWNLR
ncbi:MAG: hypothetical protein Q8T11_10235 [Elusimicrobiota bacterium]|nr:hypothetical protein [Elusimicrobiota bacterium]